MNRGEFLAVAAAAPSAIRSGRVAGTPAPLALVTADSQARIAAVNLATGRIERSLATLAGPRSIESVGGRSAVVAHTAVGAVTIVDGRSLAVRSVVREFEEPRYAAALADGRHAYVTDSARGEVAVVDVAHGRVLRRTKVGLWARHLSLEPAGRHLWIGLGTEARLVAVVDVEQPLRPRLLHRFRPPFLAHDVGFSPHGHQVWVTSGDRDRIAVYDAATARLHYTLAAGSPPQHVSFGPGVAYVTSGEDGTLRVHALANGALLRATRVPAGSYNVQQGFGRVLTPSLDVGTLCVLDGRGRLVKRVRVAPSAHDACFVSR